MLFRKRYDSGSNISSEKELRNATTAAGEENDDGNVNVGNEDTEIIDKMVDDEISTQTQNKFSKRRNLLNGMHTEKSKTHLE